MRGYRVLVYDPEIPRPKVDPNWRQKIPVGGTVRLKEYRDDSWRWISYTVVKYLPFIVQCEDRRGQTRCFCNWEFQARQKRRIDPIKGGGAHAGIEERRGEL